MGAQEKTASFQEVDEEELDEQLLLGKIHAHLPFSNLGIDRRMHTEANFSLCLGFPLNSSLEQRHRAKLMDELESALLRHDWVRAAGILSVSLRLNARSLSPRDRYAYAPWVYFLVDSCIEALRHFPKAGRMEAIRQAQSYIKATKMMEDQFEMALMTVENIVVLLETDRAEQALTGFRVPGSDVGAAARFQTAQCSALLNYELWRKSTDVNRYSYPKISSFTHDAAYWRSLNRSSADAWREAVTQTELAASIHPGDAEIMILLCHLHCVAGELQKAFEVVEKHLKADPGSPDGHAFMVLLLEASRTPDHHAEAQSDILKLEKAYLALLDSEVPSAWAVENLLKLYEDGHCSSQAVAKGILMYLDSCHRVDTECTAHCWSSLAGVLMQVSESALSTMDTEHLDGQGSMREDVWSEIEELLLSRRSWFPKLWFTQNAIRLASEASKQASGNLDTEMDGQDREEADINDAAGLLKDKAICAAFIADRNHFFSQTALSVLKGNNIIDDANHVEAALDRGEALRQAKIAQSGKSLPFGVPSFQMGCINTLPIVWWKNFPQYRQTHKQYQGQ